MKIFSSNVTLHNALQSQAFSGILKNQQANCFHFSSLLNLEQQFLFHLVFLMLFNSTGRILIKSTSWQPDLLICSKLELAENFEI